MRKSKIGLTCFLAFTLTMGMPTLTCADIETVSPGVAISGIATTITDDLPASESTIEPTVEPASEPEAEESILGMDPEVNMPSSTLPSTPSSTAQSPVIPTATTKTFLALDPFAGPRITPTPAPTEPGVVIQGWTTVKVPAFATESNVSFYNPEENASWYDLTFELRLKETDEIIFSTGLIPPGQYCNKVMLSRPLEPGIYPAILHVQPYYMNEEQTPTNDLNMDVRLIVE